MISKCCEHRKPFQILPQPIIRGVVEDVRQGVSRAQISRRFHRTLVEVLTRVCRILREDRGLGKVALGGGVFQNRTLLTEMEARLKKEGFQVYSKSLVPSNDGGISLGQAVAAHYMRRNKKTTEPSFPKALSGNTRP